MRLTNYDGDWHRTSQGSVLNGTHGVYRIRPVFPDIQQAAATDRMHHCHQETWSGVGRIVRVWERLDKTQTPSLPSHGSQSPKAEVIQQYLHQKVRKSSSSINHSPRASNGLPTQCRWVPAAETSAGYVHVSETGAGGSSTHDDGGTSTLALT